jgi:cob(I)alamin adenosyltransferase
VKIYTRGGDKGSTALIGGRRVPKNHPQIEAYGTVDELMAFVALLRDSYNDPYYKDLLLWILDRLMTAASRLAVDDPSMLDSLPALSLSDVERLEKEIDRMEAQLPQLQSFILPGGHPASSVCHIARTVCRRAERRSLELEENLPSAETIIPFLNRLSDFLFVLSRFIIKDLGGKEIVWKPLL